MEIEGIGKNVLLNGEIVEKTFPFAIVYEGQLIYEVVRIKDGYPLFWQEHLERMIHSLNLMGQAGQAIVTAIDGIIRQYIKNSTFKNNNIKIIIGNFDKGKFEYMAYYIPSFYPDAAFYRDGAKVVTLNRERENPNAKVVNLSLNAEVAKIRKDTQAYEVALVNDEGILTEGSRSNLFFLKDGCIYVSYGHKILKGITMLKVLSLFGKLTLDYLENDVRLGILDTFDACFMTSTSNNVLPIDTIDQHRFDSSHHPLIQKLMEAFDQLMVEDQNQYKRFYEGGIINE